MPERDLSVPAPAFRLHLLGAVELRAASGPEITEIVNQAKRLAVLAYLAVSSPRLHRRDSLMALFWPDLDAEHARAALRRTLHFLRRALSEPAIVSRGDEVGIDHEIIWTDVRTFSQAYSAGHFEEALDVYRGDLMEGFFVSTAPEFERWIDDQRRFLRRSAVSAAWQLVDREEQAGQPRAAVQWARRATTLEPTDERGVRRLIELLDSVGDRVSAVRAYESFSRLVTTELEVEPSPETKALVETVRRRSGATAPPEKHSPDLPSRTAANVIAVLPFAVRGSSELSYLREGMVDLFCAKLDGAGDLRTVDSHALLRYTHSNSVTLIDPDTARTIAERFHAGAFLLGSVVGAGGRIHISASLYETDGTAEHRAEAETSHESEIFAIVDDLVRALLAKRITSFGGQIGRLAAMTTDSMSALKAYLAGERAFRRARHFDGIGEYERAVSEDPSFALGHYRLAEARAACRMPILAREASTAAWEERSRLSPHAHLLLEAQRLWLDGRIAEAETLYRRLVGARTTDVEGWYHLGALQFDYNTFRGRSAVESRESFERVVALDQTHVSAMAHLTRIAAMEGKNDEVALRVDRLLALSPTGDESLPMRAVRLCLTNDSEAQEELISDLTKARSTTVATTLADIALYACDLPRALECARQLDVVAPPTVLGTLGKLLIAYLAAASGADDEAREALVQASAVDADEALEHHAFLATLPGNPVLADDAEEVQSALHGSQPSALHLYLNGLLAARLGDPTRALEYAGQCEETDVPQDQVPLHRNLALGVRARVAVDRGDAAEALALLKRLELGPWCHLAQSSPFFALANERFLRGEALLALGQQHEARGWLLGLAQRSVFELVYREAAGVLLNPTETP